jgi:hypothetical protein
MGGSLAVLLVGAIMLLVAGALLGDVGGSP